MVNCSDDVIAYHDQKTTLPQPERTAMRDRRDANRDRLKTRLKANGKPVPKEFIKQGSYAMKTMVQDADNDYDIDDGVYFTQSSLHDSHGNDLSAAGARAMVCEALRDDRFVRQPQVRKNCVRIYYDEGYHVDMPVYRIRESDGEYELACGDSWMVSRAADVEDWFHDENQRLSPDTDNGRQLRRITRLMKKFSRSRDAWKSQVAPGFTITKLVVDKYAADSDREDKALRQTMQDIHDRLTLDLEVQHPVTPGAMLTKGPNDPETRFLRERLSEALGYLKVLDEPACTRVTALGAWDRTFNSDFFAPRDTAKAARAAYGTAPAIITNPASPWSE